MHKYFLYVGTKIAGANDQAWGTPADAKTVNDADTVKAPFDGRWVDAANLVLSKYLPNGGQGWELLLNTAGDHNPMTHGARTFERFKPAGAVERAAKSPVPTPASADAYGLVKDDKWTPLALSTTSIMQGDLITAAVKAGMPKEITLKDSKGDIPRVGNSSGRTTKEALDQLCAAFQTQLTLPAFTVTDSNTFHTSGYLWAKVALDAAIAKGGAGPVLIVNFDQHQDYQTDARLVKSDGWGKAILRNYRGAFINFGCNGLTDLALNSEAFLLATSTGAGAEPVQVKDIATGVPKITMNHLVSLTKAKEYPEVSPDLAFLSANIPATLTRIQTKLGASFKYCFVTVDRDCMLNNGTQWGMSEPAFWSSANLRSVMQIVFQYLGQKQIELAGFDVTGFPEALASANPLRQEIGRKIKNVPALPEGPAMMAAMQQEIADFEALLKHYDTALPVTEGYISMARDANNYTVGFTNPEWAKFLAIGNVAARLKDGRSPNVYCLIGEEPCTVASVSLPSGSSAGQAQITTTGRSVQYGTNTKVAFSMAPVH